MVGAIGRQIRIKSVAHHGHGITRSRKDRKLCHHGLRLRQLVFAAIGHGHRSGADGGVKPLHQTLLRAFV